MKTTRNFIIQQALKAARDGHKTEFIQLVEELDFPHHPISTLDEVWLEAEYLYQQGKYAQAHVAFEHFMQDKKARSAPSWQRYLAAHRQSFVFFRQGDMLDSEGLLHEAEVIIDSDSSLEYRRSDLLVLSAYLLEELYRDYEASYTKHKEAYSHAVKHENWHRATTAAIDLGRISSVREVPGHLEEALTWLEQSRVLLKKYPNVPASRMAMIYEAIVRFRLNDRVKALTLLTQVIDESADEKTADARIMALRRRAEFQREMKAYGAAEVDYRQAIKESMGAQSTIHQMLAHKDYANMLLMRSADGDIAQGRQQFARALKILFSLTPIPPQNLMHMAQDLVSKPELVGKENMPMYLQKQLDKALQQATESSPPSHYQRSTRYEEFMRHIDTLKRILSRYRYPIIKLASCAVDPVAGAVTGDGDEWSEPIDSRTLDTLRHLLEAEDGLTVKELIDRADISESNAKESIKRLRMAIKGDLVVIGKVGNANRYAVNTGPK